MLTQRDTGYPTGPLPPAPQGAFCVDSAVVGRRGLERAFDPVPASVSAARRFVVSTLSELGVDDYTDAVVSVCSELATNAVLHARTRFTVRITAIDETVRLEVADGSGRRPARRRYSDQATTGRGLAVVERLSTNWGVEPGAAGKCVWASFETAAEEMDWDAVLAADEEDFAGTDAPGPPAVAGPLGRVA